MFKILFSDLENFRPISSEKAGGLPLENKISVRAVECITGKKNRALQRPRFAIDGVLLCWRMSLTEPGMQIVGQVSGSAVVILTVSGSSRKAPGITQLWSDVLCLRRLKKREAPSVLGELVPPPYNPHPRDAPKARGGGLGQIIPGLGGCLSLGLPSCFLGFSGGGIQKNSQALEKEEGHFLI